MMLLKNIEVLSKVTIYNMDETGFQMGMTLTAKVICGSETRANNAKAIQPANREWVTAIIAVNAAGWALPLQITLAVDNHQSQWYHAVPKDYSIRSVSAKIAGKMMD